MTEIIKFFRKYPIYLLTANSFRKNIQFETTINTTLEETANATSPDHTPTKTLTTFDQTSFPYLNCGGRFVMECVMCNDEKEREWEEDNGERRRKRKTIL